MRLIDADRLLKHTKFYNLKNGNKAIDEIDILHAPTVQAIPLDKVKQAIQEMDDLANHKIKPVSCDQSVAIEMCINIIKRLIIESEE